MLDKANYAGGLFFNLSKNHCAPDSTAHFQIMSEYCGPLIKDSVFSSVLSSMEILTAEGFQLYNVKLIK